MATAPESAATKTAADEPASYLDMPAERRAAAKAHVGGALGAQPARSRWSCRSAPTSMISAAC